jgi:hypothetical protein
MGTEVILQSVGNYPVVAKPRFVFVNTDASNATITAAGWLNSVTNQKIQATDIIVANFASNAKAFYTPSIDSAGEVTLAAVSNPGEVSLIGAAVSGNVVMFSGTTGDIADSTLVAANVLQTTTDVTDYQQIVGLNEILISSVGTWTRTRIAQGNYVLRHSVANDTSVIGIDITPAIRTAAGRGFKLASFDVIYNIAALALDAHSVVLDRVAYANNVAVAITSVPLTVTLATATQAQPYLTNALVVTPAFDVTANSKYVAELTVDAGATSEYDFYGLNLRFTKSVA